MKKALYILLLSFVFNFTIQTITIAAEKSDKTASAFSKLQVEQIEKIVHNYLVNNPKILMEVSQKLQEQEAMEQKAQIAKIRADIPKYKNQLFDAKAPGRIILGNPKGKIMVVEFTQHQCPHCKKTSITVNKLIKNNKDVQLMVVYWPFFGSDAIYAAKAVLAAQKQNKAEELDLALFTYNGLVTKDKTEEIIKSIPGIDSKKLLADMNDKALEKGLRDNLKLAQDLKLIGTPTVVFANKDMTKFSLVPGQTEHFEDDLNQSLKEVQ